MKKYRENGITLVALVVTIVILLILAGISIAQLTGNGLFEKAKEAKEKSENAKIEEDEKLSDYENKIGEYVNGTRDTNANNYSTSETPIGTWVDGKTLYRKVFLGTTSSSSSDTTINVADLNIDTLINVKGGVHYGNTKASLYPTSTYFTSNDAVIVWANDADLKIRCLYSTAKGKPYTYIIEYTKTTDIAPTN